MLKKTGNDSYKDMGSGHCGQFSGDFHAAGKYRYMSKKKRPPKKTGLAAIIRIPDTGMFGKRIKLDPNPAFFKILARTVQKIRREGKDG